MKKVEAIVRIFKLEDVKNALSAKGIHGMISGDSLKAGSGPPSTTVGESYSLNFFNSLPADPQKNVAGVAALALLSDYGKSRGFEIEIYKKITSEISTCTSMTTRATARS